MCGLTSSYSSPFGEGVHERVGDRDGDVEVGDAAVELALDELEDVGVVDAQDAHVGAAPGAALLDRLGGAVEDPQEGDRARRLPPVEATTSSFGRRREKAKPVPPPDLWMMAADFTASKISSMESPTGRT